MTHNTLKNKSSSFIKPVKRVYTFYRDGFRGMVLGKKLWKIILIKLFIMFAVLKLFFFPNFLKTNFQTDEEKSNYVLEQITKNASLNTQEGSFE
ncbi:MAG: DUF4492 domain-containing protein [Thermodesulfobacteriota bacterium]